MSRPFQFDFFARRACKLAGFAVACLVAMCVVPALVSAQVNLLRNPGLTVSSGNTPDNWQHAAFTASSDDVTFDVDNSVQPPELEVWNYQPADSRWTQKLHLKPGWYHFTASVRTENVGEVDTGANISIMDSWILSRHVRGSGYWEPVGFYLQVPSETDVTFACRLGFYSSVNTGRADFRDLSVTGVAEPASDGDPRYKLEITPQLTARAKTS